MTTPRDALRALIRSWRELDTDFAAYKFCADELAAIVSKMDSEPTVAQWREAFKDWRRGGVGFTGLEAVDWIEQRARDLAAKDKQP